MSPESAKAQASMEFMTIMGVMLIIFLGLATISTEQTRAANDAALQLSMSHTCNDFASRINAVYTGGSGFTAHATMPQTIRNQNYGIAVNGKTVVLNVGQKVVFCRILTGNVTYISINKGPINLTNANGAVSVS